MACINYSISEDFKIVKKVYPELSLLYATTMPTAVGIVVAPEFRNMAREIKNEYTFPIKIIYPSNFPDYPISVYDLERKIDWNLIPDKYRHVYPDGSICTHHPRELQEVHFKNRTLVIINSAIRLYYAYKHYLKTNCWVIKDLPHGEFSALLEIVKDKTMN